MASSVGCLPELEFSSTVFTMGAVFTHHGDTLPLFVKSCDDSKRTGTPLQHEDSLPPGVIMLLERKEVVQYAHVRILKFPDDSKVVKEKGRAFVDERNAFVGEEFLIPVNYPGNLKIVHRPGGRIVYNFISEVIVDLPHYLRVDKDVMAVPPRNMGRVQLVPATTKLEVKGLITSDSMKYIKCATGKKTYVLAETCAITCSAIPDPCVYTLSELISKILLPKVVQFQYISPNDVVENGDEVARKYQTLTAGPIEVINLEKRTLAIGCVIQDTGKQFEQTSVLIPSEIWENTHIQMVTQHAEGNKTDFRFKYDSSIIDKKFYLMSATQHHSVTWLRDTSTDLASDYEIPIQSKPSPTEIPLLPTEISSLATKTTSLAISRPPLSPRMSHENPAAYKKSQSGVKLPTKKSIRQPDIFHRLYRWTRRKEYNKSESHTSTGENHDKNTTEVKTSVDESRPAMPLPPKCSIKKEHHYDYPFVEFTNKFEINSIMRQNQTREDFYKYTVKQVSKCFELCALKKLGQICAEEQIDGSFFKIVDDSDCLVEEPFSLSVFDISKVNMIINHGWRPK